MWRKWIYTWMFLLLGCTDSPVPQSTFPGDNSKCQVEDLLSIGIQLKEAILRKDTKYILNLLDPKEKITIEKVEGYTTREKMIKDFAEHDLSYSIFFDTERKFKLLKKYGVDPPSTLPSIREELLAALRKKVLRVGVEKDPCCSIVFRTASRPFTPTGGFGENIIEFSCQSGSWKIRGLFYGTIIDPPEFPENCKLPDCSILWESVQLQK